MNPITEATQCPAYHHLTTIDENQCPTHHRILDTALGIIKTEGLEGFTIRRIASEAKVNVAAINYHFQNKDSLLEAAMMEIARPIFEQLQALVQDPALGPRQKLKTALVAYGQLALSFPLSVLQAFAFNRIRMVPSQEMLSMKQHWLREVFKITGELLQTDDQTVILVTTVQLFSTIAFPFLIMPHKQEMLDKLGIRYPSMEEQVEILLNNFFPEKK